MRKIVIILLVICMLGVTPFSALATESDVSHYSDEEMQAYDSQEEKNAEIYVLEESAMFASEAPQEPGTNGSRASDTLRPPHLWDDPFPESYPPYTKTDEAYNVEFVLTVYYLGDAKYRCELDATYLETPEVMSYDGMGIIVQACTFYGNAAASISADVLQSNTFMPPEISVSTCEVDLTSSIQVNAFSDGVCGCGVSYNLEEVFELDTLENIATDNISLHLEFEIVLTYPTLETYFQVYTFYEHVYTECQVQPSFSFNSDGGSFSFSFVSVVHKQSHNFLLNEPIHYLP